MRKSIRFFVALLALCCVEERALSQTYMDAIADAIEVKVHNLYGGRYTVNIVVLVDSSLNKRPFPVGPIEDPYGTLKECVIFTAEPFSKGDKSRAFVGIYKNDHIVWYSDTTISITDSYQHDIIATTDLNNDGKVDIVTSWLYGMRMNLERLWIFSWDGQNGTVINDYDEKNLSVIRSYEGMFLLVDIDADGILEIQGVENPGTENREVVNYTWSGQLYGNWQNPPQPLPSGYLPKNRLEVNVKAMVAREGGDFVFHYDLENKSTSIQKAHQFLFPQRTDSVRAKAARGNWRFGHLRRQLCGWRGDEISPNSIPRGTTESNFACESRGLPALLPYYVQGENFSWGQPSVNMQTLEINEDLWYQDIITNSFRGTTIGPADPPSPFVPADFLDTLSAYTTQSRSLGWITSQTVADKYVGYFTSAKTQLRQNNATAARTTLQSVLRDVDIDSSSAITSEAYALLRFNTEYLLGKLPAVLAITALNPAMTLAGSGAFTLTVSGSNFINGSTVNWKGSARTTTFAADSILQASILASDVAAADSPPVTVKNPDGSESNALRFYVLSAIAWIDTLVSYKHRAVELGWLRGRRDDDCDDDEKPDDGIVKNLDKRLEKARKELVKEDSVQARKELEKFVKKVEQLRKRSEEAEKKNKPDQVIITKEAYLLLKNNADYLIERLPEKKGKGKK